jgi:DNA integrity scanning protein DisA with diadenylate cyclase activity
MVDAALSTRLIENIFFKNTPLHDGALIIHNGRIWSAACILPVSKRTDLPKRYGLRHRAAIGLTEKTDAMAIVVSEETGKISVAKGEDIHTVTQEELKSYLLQVFGAELNAEEKRDNK